MFLSVLEVEQQMEQIPLFHLLANFLFFQNLVQ